MAPQASLCAGNLQSLLLTYSQAVQLAEIAEALSCALASGVESPAPLPLASSCAGRRKRPGDRSGSLQACAQLRRRWPLAAAAHQSLTRLPPAAVAHCLSASPRLCAGRRAPAGPGRLRLCACAPVGRLHASGSGGAAAAHGRGPGGARGGAGGAATLCCHVWLRGLLFDLLAAARAASTAAADTPSPPPLRAHLPCPRAARPGRRPERGLGSVHLRHQPLLGCGQGCGPGPARARAPAGGTRGGGATTWRGPAGGGGIGVAPQGGAGLGAAAAGAAADRGREVGGAGRAAGRARSAGRGARGWRPGGCWRMRRLWGAHV